MAKWGGGEILRRAVRGMLPKNRLRDDRMSRLKCFEGEDHPYKLNLWRTGEVKKRLKRTPGVRKELEERQRGLERRKGGGPVFRKVEVKGKEEQKEDVKEQQ